MVDLSNLPTNPYIPLVKSVKSSNPFLQFLDTLGTGQRIVTGAIGAVQTGQPILETAIKSATMENPINTSDILSNAGWTEPSLGKTIASFAGDVLTDPLTYVGPGLGKALMKSTKGLGIGKQLMKIPGSAIFSENLPEGFKDIRREARYRTASGHHEILKKLEKLSKGFTPEDADLMVRARQFPERIPLLPQKTQERLIDIGNEFVKAGQESVDSGHLTQEVFDRMKDTYVTQIYQTNRIAGSTPSLFNRISTNPTYAKLRTFANVEEAEAFSKKIVPLITYKDAPSALQYIKDNGLEDIFKGRTTLEDIQSIATVASEQYKPIVNIFESLGSTLTERANVKNRDIIINSVLENKELATKLPMGTKLALPGKSHYMPIGGIRFFSQPYVSLTKFADVLHDSLKTLESVTGAAATMARNKIDDIFEQVGISSKFKSIEDIKNELSIGEVLTKELDDMAGKVGMGFIKEVDIGNVTKKMMAVSGKVPIYEMDTNVVKAMNRVEKGMAGDDANLRKFIGYMKGAQSLWKSGVTVLNWAFHMRNIQSNLYLAWLADVNPLKMPFLSKKSLGLQMGESLTLKNGTKYTGEEISKIMADKGITGGGVASLDNPIAYRKEMDRVLDNTFMGNAKHKLNPITLGRNFGTAIEDNTRISVFLDQLDKGKSIDEAALQVRKYLFDYGDLTPFEQGTLKQWIPFYTWMRKNLPLQVKTIIEKPQKAAQVGHLYSNLNQLGGETPEQNKEIRNMYNQNVYIKSPWKSPKNNPLYYSVDLPINDLAKFSQMKQTFWSMLSPYVGIIANSMGFKLFPEVREYSEYPVAAPWYIAGLDKVAPEVTKAMGCVPITDYSSGKQILGCSEKSKYWMTLTFPFLNQVDWMFPTTVDLSEEAPYKMASILTGVKIREVDYNKENYYQGMRRLSKYKELIHSQNVTPSKLKEVLEKHY